MILREVYDLLSYHRRHGHRFATHDCRNAFMKAVRDLDRAGFGPLRNKRVLDLGCGQRFPFALQSAAAGATVTALDLEYVRPDPLPVALYQTWRTNGIKRAAKSTLRRVLFDGRYYRTLETVAERPLWGFRSNIAFVVVDPEAETYPLPSSSFDLAASNAVVEHVADVGRFAAEVDRMVAPGGYFYAIIHNYYSLSGGHNLEWAFPDENPSRTVPPWDHLRENRFPAWSPLNRLKPEQYVDAFSELFDVVLFEGRDINHDPGGLEGEQVLTPELASELSAYPRELLLTRAWCMICRKR